MLTSADKFLSFIVSDIVCLSPWIFDLLLQSLGSIYRF